MANLQDRQQVKASSEHIDENRLSENKDRILQTEANAGKVSIRIPHNLKLILNNEAADYSLTTQRKLPIGDVLLIIVTEYLKQNKTKSYNQYKQLKLI